MVFRNPQEEIACVAENVITAINVKILQTFPKEPKFYDKGNVVSDVYLMATLSKIVELTINALTVKEKIIMQLFATV